MIMMVPWRRWKKNRRDGGDWVLADGEPAFRSSFLLERWRRIKRWLKEKRRFIVRKG